MSKATQLVSQEADSRLTPESICNHHNIWPSSSAQETVEQLNHRLRQKKLKIKNLKTQKIKIIDSAAVTKTKRSQGRVI